jgi:hypothetical protein
VTSVSQQEDTLASAPSTGTIAPGIATATSGYPQYGVNQAGNIIEATSASQEATYQAQGYLVWFTSKSAAQDYNSSQSGVLSGNIPNPLSGIAGVASAISAIAGALKGFGDLITRWQFWASIGWLLLGLALMFAGVFVWLKANGIEPPIPIPVPV